MHPSLFDANHRSRVRPAYYMHDISKDRLARRVLNSRPATLCNSQRQSCLHTIPPTDTVTLQLIHLCTLTMLRTMVRKQVVPQPQDHTCRRCSTESTSMADSNNSLDQHCLTVAMGSPATHSVCLIVQPGHTTQAGNIDKTSTPFLIARTHQ
jgi:hypothetical protein